MAGLRTAVILEAVETLDGQGLPGTVMVKELCADLTDHSADEFANKLNKRVQAVLKYTEGQWKTENEGSDDDDDGGEGHEKAGQSPDEEKVEKKKKITKRLAKPAGTDDKPVKSVDDLLNEIV